MQFIRLQDAKTRNPLWSKSNRSVPAIVQVHAGEIIEGDQFSVSLCLADNPVIAPYCDEAVAAVAKAMSSPARHETLARFMHAYNLRASMPEAMRDAAERLYAAHKQEIATRLEKPIAEASQTLEALGKTSTSATLQNLYEADNDALDAAIIDLKSIDASTSITNAIKLLKEPDEDRND